MKSKFFLLKWHFKITNFSFVFNWLLSHPWIIDSKNFKFMKKGWSSIFLQFFFLISFYQSLSWDIKIKQFFPLVLEAPKNSNISMRADNMRLAIDVSKRVKINPAEVDFPVGIKFRENFLRLKAKKKKSFQKEKAFQNAELKKFIKVFQRD